MTDLERYLPESIRSHIEESYYARVNRQAALEALLQDEDFLQNPDEHVGLFTDHGVVHVRDVAAQILQVLDIINGVLIPRRDRTRLDFFMKGYGVILAYLHDIGMVDFSAFGRAMHPAFASQYVFSADFDPLLQTIWDENCGNISWRLVKLYDNPQRVLREMLAMANCHSKSKVPVAVLNDPRALRQTMQSTLATRLESLYAHHQNQPAELMDNLDSLAHLYDDFLAESYTWLLAENPQEQALAQDVIDTLRALRCADALRQRGTVLKTSGSYEIFVDQMTANAIYALRQGSESLFLLETPAPLGAGEANLASSELGRDGNLRIAFHRGAFTSPEVVARAVYCAAMVVNDIQSDVIESFKRPAPLPGIKPHHDIQILLEGVDDNLTFAEQVREELIRLNPELRQQAHAVPSLQHISTLERDIYLNAPDFDWDESRREALLEKIAQSGQKIDTLDPVECFRHVKVLTLRGGETLIEAGSPAGFVYIPLGEGLKIIPLGGYQPFSVAAWMPLGNTGVIRGAIRNASVITDQDVQLLMIPKEVYLRQWHNPFTVEEFAQRLRKS